MIVTCPECGKRYKLDASRLNAGRRRLRCAACGHIFAVEREGASVPPASRPVVGKAAGKAVGTSRPVVLVADEPREFRDLVCRILRELGCQVETTDDGESALETATRLRPQLVVLNVYLRKLLGVAVCEAIKGKPELRDILVALVGSVFKSDRFVRTPQYLYGADDYFEDVIAEADMRARFHAILTRTGHLAAERPAAARGPAAGPAAGAAGARSDPGGGRSSAVDPLASPGARAAPVGGIDPGIEPRAEIRRLARIMLSDLKIYYPDRFDRAVSERHFFESFRDELTRGKDLIAGRFPNLPDRLEILAGALREGLNEERGSGGTVAGAVL